jgi:DeoR/GlpR family transcriptional regulator of sugar metabolism
MTTGYKFQQELRQYRFDKSMFSCAGITTQGLFYSKMEPLLTAQTMQELSNCLILLADSSKMNNSAFLYGMDTRRISILVTDDGILPDSLDRLHDLIPKIIVAPTQEL